MVQNIYAISEFQGLSTDLKPSGVQLGSTFYELDTKNIYIFDGIVWQQSEMHYKDLGAVIDTTNMAAGAIVYSNWYDGVDWVRRFITLILSDQQHDVYLNRRDTSGTSTVGNDTVLLASLPAIAPYRSRCFTSEVNVTELSGLLGYSVRFGLKNSSASPNTYGKLRVQLLGL